jgi:putative flippase GtrA
MQKYKQAAALFFAFIIAGLLAQILKFTMPAPRPSLYFQQISFVYHHFVSGVNLSGSNSFPSGHTATAFAMATVLALMSRRQVIGLLCLFAALFVGYSRIYLAQHFLLDVTVSMFIGTLVGLLSFYFVEQWFSSLPKFKFFNIKKGNVQSVVINEKKSFIDLFSRGRIIELVKFGMVGCSGLVIDFAITYFFKEYVGINKFVANTLGFSVAVANNYLINRFWTFRGSNGRMGTQFIKFLLVSIIGLGINTVCIYAMQQWGQLSFYPAKFFAIAIVFIWNYTINAFITFKKNEI